LQQLIKKIIVRGCIRFFFTKQKPYDKVPAAAKSLRSAMRLDPRSVDAIFALGNCLLAVGDKDELAMDYTTGMFMDATHVFRAALVPLALL